VASPLKVGLAGLGTVGASVFRLVTSEAATLAERAGRALEIVAVSARDPSRARGLDLSNRRWHADPVALAKDPEVDVVVELIGGAAGIARHVVVAALSRGVPVVTANKALLAESGPELAALAERNGVTIAYEAAVAGGIPIIKTLRESLAGNAIRRVAGILNGTCNDILSRMEAEGLEFEACLAMAQALGYAEADPDFDIEGHDSAHKLALLAALAFGTRVDVLGVYVEGISGITPLDLRMARELGFRIKLLGVAERKGDAIEQRVHPTFVSRDAPLAQVMGVLNAVMIEADPVGMLTLIGPGAGGEATASAVIADLIDLARGNQRPTFGIPTLHLRPLVKAPMQRHEGGYYIRLQVLDQPGAAATIAGKMAAEGISLESILQKWGEGHSRADPPRRDSTGARSVPVILITYATTEASIRIALAEIARSGVIEGVPQVIRIER